MRDRGPNIHDTQPRQRCKPKYDVAATVDRIAQLDRAIDRRRALREVPQAILPAVRLLVDARFRSRVRNV